MKNKAIIVILMLIFGIIIFACSNNQVNINNPKNNNTEMEISKLNETKIDFDRDSIHVESTINVDEAKPLSFDDFIVRGDNSITRNENGPNIIDIYAYRGVFETAGFFFNSFITGDVASTYRKISLNDTYADIIEKYGKGIEGVYTIDENDIINTLNTKAITINNYTWTDLGVLNYGDRFVDYTYLYDNQYDVHLRFYFNIENKVIMILYYYN
ncbi:MAG: hypothetical protein IKP66_05490 [Lachnospiraceae bacterium]|nr:hypothetical protein [Lachnospiraceae bacterium]